MTHLTYLQQHLCGLTEDHVNAKIDGQYVLPQVADAFWGLREAAAADGHDLRIASGFRSFARQAAIWQRKVDALQAQQSLPDYHQILRWSAMPGASRHHWGSDMDIYDAQALGDAQLQLEVSEYQGDGPMAPLYAWLLKHAPKHGFFWPYDKDRGGVAAEPWHLSYAPASVPLLEQFSEATLSAAWAYKKVAAMDWLIQHRDDLFERYVTNVASP